MAVTKLMYLGYLGAIIMTVTKLMGLAWATWELL